MNCHMSRYFFRLEVNILTNRTDIGKGGADGLIRSGWEVIREFQHFHFIGCEFYKGARVVHAKKSWKPVHAIVFTDIVIFMLATERNPKSENRTSVKRLSNRSRKISLSAHSTQRRSPRLPSSSIFYDPSPWPRGRILEKTSSPRIYQRIHRKQIRYDHFFFPCPLSAYIPVQREIPLKLVLQIQDKGCAIVP